MAGSEAGHGAGARGRVFSPAQLVSLISRDITLAAGDIISCGTSLGIGPIKAGNTVEIAIDGIGTRAIATATRP